MPEEDNCPFIIHPFENFDQILGKSSISRYVKEYLEHISAKTCICETEYIDKDYLIDYSKFYARSYSNIPKLTKRYHFFKEEISKENFQNSLETNDPEKIKLINESYLGFIVVKEEIKDPLSNYLFGRTLLITYEQYDGADERIFLKHRYQANLFGINLGVESLPFQQQDEAVGACATVACWVSHFPLQQLFGIQLLSPIEITERAQSIPSDCRNFPTEGLTPEQIKLVYNSLGMDTEFIKTNFDEIGLYHPDRDDIIADAVRGYINYRLPIIACLVDGTDGQSKRHAVVISGYRHNNGEIKELYVHDDETGPYHRIKPTEGKFLNWKDNHPRYGDINWIVDCLIVPVYPKIRLSFSRIYNEYLRERRTLEGNKRIGTSNENSTLNLFLTDVKEYKKFVLNNNIKNKAKILTKHLPRFIWVIRARNDSAIHYDVIYDGTAVYAQKIAEVNYEIAEQTP